MDVDLSGLLAFLVVMGMAALGGVVALVSAIVMMVTRRWPEKRQGARAGLVAGLIVAAGGGLLFGMSCLDPRFSDEAAPFVAGGALLVAGIVGNRIARWRTSSDGELSP